MKVTNESGKTLINISEQEFREIFLCTMDLVLETEGTVLTNGDICYNCEIEKEVVFKVFNLCDRLKKL